MIMTAEEQETKSVTSPSDTNPERLKTPEFMDSSISSGRPRSNMMASVGKIFSRSKKKLSKRAKSPSTSSKTKGEEEEMALTPVEMKSSYRDSYR